MVRSVVGVGAGKGAGPACSDIKGLFMGFELVWSNHGAGTLGEQFCANGQFVGEVR